MFATIWMCTHEWSLISIRATAFTFETCHQPLSCLSALTRSISVRSLRLPRTGTLIFIRSIASAGVSRASRSASSEAGWSIRSAVSLSIDIEPSLFLLFVPDRLPRLARRRLGQDRPLGLGEPVVERRQHMRLKRDDERAGDRAADQVLPEVRQPDE